MQVSAQQLYFALAGMGLGVLLGAAIAAWLRGRRIADLERALAVLEERLRSEEALIDERDAVIAQADERLTHLLGELADKSLQSRSDTFLKLAQESVGQQQTRAGAELRVTLHKLVGPIAQALTRTEEQVAKIEAERQQAYGSIRQELKAMAESQAALRAETRQLVTALRRPEVRGQWGELTLRRLVELAGMQEHTDFVEQPHVVGDDGALRPDMIVHLPEARDLVVDAKTPLDAYLEATEASDDEARQQALARHARNLRTHVRTLADRKYWSALESTPEFVILFVPGDQFLSAALAEDADLLDDAIRRKVILATPSSLIALLKSVAYGWRQLSLARNANRIRELAETLYKRLGTFTSHMSTLGRQLENSVKGFNKAVGSLERSVLPSARRFAELGVEGEALESLEPVEQLPRAVEAPPAQPPSEAPQADWVDRPESFSPSAQSTAQGPGPADDDEGA
ncbi:MAG: DNA recombination protein RmuC [Pseudomonadota bacterium]